MARAVNIVVLPWGFSCLSPASRSSRGHQAARCLRLGKYALLMGCRGRQGGLRDFTRCVRESGSGADWSPPPEACRETECVCECVCVHVYFCMLVSTWRQQQGCGEGCVQLYSGPGYGGKRIDCLPAGSKTGKHREGSRNSLQGKANAPPWGQRWLSGEQLEAALSIMSFFEL